MTRTSHSISEIAVQLQPLYRLKGLYTSHSISEIAVQLQHVELPPHWLSGHSISEIAVQLQLNRHRIAGRSEEHTSELQSLMRISYAVFCLKKKTTNTQICTHDKTQNKTY